MNHLLDQFLIEAREFLQAISEKLMQLEREPDSIPLINELFRLVHTLKGNSGLFSFPEMTRALHAGEDLLDAVRDGQVTYSQQLTDRLLETMDFVAMLIDEVGVTGANRAEHAGNAAQIAESLRALIKIAAPATEPEMPPSQPKHSVLLPLDTIPEAIRIAAYGDAASRPQEPVSDPVMLWWIDYSPETECFFKGEDPFFLARQTPGLIWACTQSSVPWPRLTELDAYRCVVVFRILCRASAEVLYEHFRYIPEQVCMYDLPAINLALPLGDYNGGPVYEDFVDTALQLLDRNDRAGLIRAVQSMLELSSPDLWVSSVLRWLMLVLQAEPENQAAQRALIVSLRTLTAPEWDADAEMTHAAVQALDLTAGENTASAVAAVKLPIERAHALDAILSVQRQILRLPDGDAWQAGRLKAVAATLQACLLATGQVAALAKLDSALIHALQTASAAPLLSWLDCSDPISASVQTGPPKPATAADVPPTAELEAKVETTAPDGESRYGRRAEDVGPGTTTLKVDQTKIDRLMNLIGEMVVAKNSLPYLADRAETQYGVRDLAREIKGQYAVINRIAEEMQDSIMQVRMMPVSSIFRRFPRLVRDLSRKLGKQVSLVLEGEDTEADKNIVEALADPLIHILRNSLDHGIELPDVRNLAGKPAEGRLCIRATQESDRVVIAITDDGKGIDPAVIKRKAYEKGIIDESTLERISDQEAINLIFSAGFSTMEVVSDLSGRGVGMDVVRNAVEKINGSVQISSETGIGTCIRMSLPLTMAVTNVMIVESDRQIFGVPMDMVVETVRVPRSSIRSIKLHQTTVLRGRIVPLLSLNRLLAVDVAQQANADSEFATLVVRIQGEPVGIVVDDFHSTVDIILKPMAGILGGLAGYAGSALLGDGSVLMVLNPRELV